MAGIVEESLFGRFGTHFMFKTSPVAGLNYQIVKLSKPAPHTVLKNW
jgi:hypothetical protein